MTGPEMLGKILLALGGLIILVGLLVLLLDKIGLGRLPGDIFIQRENFTFYFPVMTCIIISVILTIILSLLFKR